MLILTIVTIRLLEQETNNLGIDKKAFQLNPEVEINEVILNGQGNLNRFTYSDGFWHLNDSLLLDQSMRDVFFSVVSHLEIRRPVLASRKDSIVNILLDQGIKTTISFGGDTLLDYWVAGNRKLQVSWIMGQDHQPYQVHIPGYQSYVAGIFSVPTEDWRSRFLLNINFGLVRSIELDYAESTNDVLLDYDNGFFTMRNSNADSTEIANFLDQISFLQADQFLDKEAAKTVRRSMANMTLLAELKFLLVNGSTWKIRFLRLESDKANIYAILEDGTIASIDQQRLKELFKNPVDFE